HKKLASCAERPTMKSTVKTSPTSSDIRCYNCQETGHISKNCDKPRQPNFCTACKKEGHSRRECKQPLWSNCPVKIEGEHRPSSASVSSTSKGSSVLKI